jgi:putative SOS response-associated peptidase YedK
VEGAASGEWVRTLTILTTAPNELAAPLHARTRMILDRADYDRWLGDEPDPADLIRPYGADDMAAWPVRTRVNKADNDDAAILDRVEAAA